MSDKLLKYHVSMKEVVVLSTFDEAAASAKVRRLKGMGLDPKVETTVEPVPKGAG